MNNNKSLEWDDLIQMYQKPIYILSAWIRDTEKSYIDGRWCIIVGFDNDYDNTITVISDDDGAGDGVWRRTFSKDTLDYSWKAFISDSSQNT